MRVLICGARDFNNRRKFFNVLNGLHKMYHFTMVIHGGAKGADTMAGEWARRHHIPVQVFPPNWKEYGRAAGPIRNKQMLDEGKPNLVIAFPKTTIENSLGTRNMVQQTIKAGIKYLLYES